MTTRVLSVAGVLVIVAGVVFTLQGVGVIGGSFMSGSARWAVIGAVLVVAGLGLYLRATRGR